MALTNHREAGEFGEGATMRSGEGLRDDPMYLAFLRRIGDGRKDWTAEQDDADVVALLVSDGYAVRHDVYAHSILITKAGANYLALIDRMAELEAREALIREEAAKENSPYGRSDGLALGRIRTVLGLDPHTGATLAGDTP